MVSGDGAASLIAGNVFQGFPMTTKMKSSFLRMIVLLCFFHASAFSAQAPTLTKVTPFTGAVEDTAFVITYAMLQAAADETGRPNATIYFDIYKSNGTLTYRTTGTTSEFPVPNWGTLLAQGQELVWRPALNQNGLITAFSVRAYDGSAYSSNYIAGQVAVSAVNDAPTMYTFTNETVTMYEDTPFLLRTDIADVETPYANLLVAYTSSNPSLIDASGLSIIGTAGANSLRIVPKQNQYGLAQISITVTDGEGSTVYTSRNINVVSVNDNPTISSVDTFTDGIEDTDYTFKPDVIVQKSDAKDVEDSGLRGLQLTAGSNGIVRIRSGISPYRITTAPPGGNVYVNGWDTIIWTPLLNTTGAQSPFSVAVVDSQGSLSLASVPVTVLLAAVNDAPTLTGCSPLSGAIEDSAYVISHASLSAAAGEFDVAWNRLTLACYM
jgi:hypothetical protein